MADLSVEDGQLVVKVLQVLKMERSCMKQWGMTQRIWR